MGNISIADLYLDFCHEFYVCAVENTGMVNTPNFADASQKCMPIWLKREDRYFLVSLCSVYWAGSNKIRVDLWAMHLSKTLKPGDSTSRLYSWCRNADLYHLCSTGLCHIQYLVERPDSGVYTLKNLVRIPQRILREALTRDFQTVMVIPVMHFHQEASEML